MEEIRDATEADFDAILLLNESEVQQTSPMNFQQLQALASMAAFCKVLTVEGQVAAFLIALQEGASYRSDNYIWFSERFEHFLYVDRIVVGSQFSGRGIGSKLYDNLFSFARDNRIGTITCEYNIVPPNLASRAFHDKYGFKELGTQWLAGGSKQVSLQAVET